VEEEEGREEMKSKILEKDCEVKSSLSYEMVLINDNME
jgi:hypothetical protein